MVFVVTIIRSVEVDIDSADIVSPQNQGLFHAAILQSGTALGPYTAPRRPPGSYAAELAEVAGCGDKDTLECLRNMPARKLYLHLLHFNSDSCSVRSDLKRPYPGPWIPWQDSSLDRPFLPFSPSAAEDAGVPIMMGFNAECRLRSPLHRQVCLSEDDPRSI